MNKKIVPIFLALVLLSACYSTSLRAEDDKEKQFTHISKMLKEERFEQLYSESSDRIKLQITQQKFVGEMKVAVYKMRLIDKDLNFKRDIGWERVSPESDEKDRGITHTVHVLQNDNNAAFITVFWDNEGPSPKFDNLLIGSSDYPDKKWSDEYEFKGIY